MTRYVIDSVNKNLETDSMQLENQQKRMNAVRDYTSMRDEYFGTAPIK